MGKVVFQDPIDRISGKISEKFQTVYNYRKGSKRKYTQVRSEREQPASALETATRNKFRIVRRAANERASNTATILGDTAAYRTARKSGDGHSTFNGWMFAQAWKYFDENTKTVIWPENL